MDELSVGSNALKVRWLANPKEHPSQSLSANYSLHLSPRCHLSPAALSQRVRNHFKFLSFVPQIPCFRLTTLSIQQSGCLNGQVLFVHRVHSHVCQKELLQCSITALMAREHCRHKINKKTRGEKLFASYVVLLKFQAFRGGVSVSF